MLLTRVIFFFTFAAPTFAAVKEVWWNLTYVDKANPDGLYERRVIGVNGTWPCVLSSHTRRRLNLTTPGALGRRPLM